jgi:hypothetical protein
MQREKEILPRGILGTTRGIGSSAVPHTLRGVMETK